MVLQAKPWIQEASGGLQLADLPMDLLHDPNSRVTAACHSAQGSAGLLPGPLCHRQELAVSERRDTLRKRCEELAPLLLGFCVFCFGLYPASFVSVPFWKILAK